MIKNYFFNNLIKAENIAKEYSITREEQDEYAAKSQQRAEAAIAAGYFKNEIVPVSIVNRKETIVISSDEFPKAGTTAQGLAKLRPVFTVSNERIKFKLKYNLVF